MGSSVGGAWVPSDEKKNVRVTKNDTEATGTLATLLLVHVGREQSYE